MKLKQRRLTASNFGRVIKRRATTSPQNLIKSLLSKKMISNPAIEYGKKNENVAKQQFEKLYGLDVVDAGLFIDETYGFLGASPDGKILLYLLLL